MSHQNVVKITNKLVEEFNSLKKRDLLEQKIAYLILDVTKLAVRANTKKKEAVMGLNEQILLVIDSCPGLRKAVRELFSKSKIQRCTKHRMDTVLNLLHI